MILEIHPWKNLVSWRGFVWSGHAVDHQTVTTGTSTVWPASILCWPPHREIVVAAKSKVKPCEIHLQGPLSSIEHSHESS